MSDAAWGEMLDMGRPILSNLGRGWRRRFTLLLIALRLEWARRMTSSRTRDHGCDEVVEERMKELGLELWLDVEMGVVEEGGLV